MTSELDDAEDTNAELLDVLAEQLDEQPAETSLTDLVACYAEGAADAHQIPWNGWIRDGLETVALFGLAMTDPARPCEPFTGDQLAARFAQLPASRQKAWLITAADLLHATNHAHCYGPPIGEDSHPEPTRDIDRAATRQPGAEARPARADQPTVEPLPARIAPTSGERLALSDLVLPRTGGPVVIALGHVMWLVIQDPAAAATEANTRVWGAAVVGTGHEATRWDAHTVGALDPASLMHTDAEVEAIQTAWTLLIDLANQGTPETAPR